MSTVVCLKMTFILKVNKRPQILITTNNYVTTTSTIAAVLALMTSTSVTFAWVEIGMLTVLGILIFKVKTDRPKYITSLLVEAIPVFWLALSYVAFTYC